MGNKLARPFLEKMAQQFAILADATRLMVIYCLLKGGEMNVTQIVEAIGRSHQNVSKHLRQLRNARLVARRKEGLQVFYRLDDPLIEKLCQLVCKSVLEEEALKQDPC